MDQFSRHIDRRRAVFAVLLQARPVSLTVDEVIAALLREGMAAPHRKAMADLLGGLVRSGRAVRTERGRYRAAEGWSRSTVWRARHWRELMDRWRATRDALYGPRMSQAPTVRVERDGPVTIVTIDRPEARNAVDGPTARQLHDAFRAFDADDAASVAVLTGAGGTFCAGADLKAVATRPWQPRVRRPATSTSPRAPGRWGPPGCCSASRSSPPSRGTPWPAGSSWRRGATCGWRHATPRSACSAGGGACRSSTGARCGCLAWSGTRTPWT